MMLSTNLRQDALNERSQYTIEKESQLGRWRADITSMEMQIGDGNLTYRDKVTELKREINMAEEQLEKLKGATDDAWNELKSSADLAWEALSASVEKVKQELKKNIN